MTPQSAHDCFTAAELLRARGRYLDAQILFDRACTLEPENATYAEARDRLQRSAHAFFKKGGTPSGEPTKWFDSTCWSNGCECCCEGCGEGCCEGICEGCGDGCDCDCS